MERLSSDVWKSIFEYLNFADIFSLNFSNKFFHNIFKKDRLKKFLDFENYLLKDLEKNIKPFNDEQEDLAEDFFERKQIYEPIKHSLSFAKDFCDFVKKINGIFFGSRLFKIFYGIKHGSFYSFGDFVVIVKEIKAEFIEFHHVFNVKFITFYDFYGIMGKKQISDINKIFFQKKILLGNLTPFLQRNFILTPYLCKVNDDKFYIYKDRSRLETFTILIDVLKKRNIHCEFCSDFFKILYQK